MTDHLKNQTIDTLSRFGFIMIHDGGEVVYMDSPKKNDFRLPLVQAFIYQNANGCWLVELDGAFKAPLIGNEGLFLDYLFRYYPDWHSV